MTAFRYARRTESLKPSAVREILKATQSPAVISFAGGLPAPELFPIADVDRAARTILAAEGPAALQYATTEGHPPLRAWVCQHLATAVSLTAAPSQVLITTGSQQALDLVARALLDPGDMVLVERPAYLGALQAFQAAEASFLQLESDDEGARPDSLARALAGPARPKLLYLNTTFQNPTGVTMSLLRRREIAGLAAAAAVPILEDDPYGRLRYSGDDLPALASLPEARNVLYLGTSSKVLAPGLRVAWLVVPDATLFDRLVTLKQATDLHTSPLAQRLVHAFVSDTPRFHAHLAALAATYRGRRDTMLRALEAHMPPGVTWTRPAGGLFLWLRLPAGTDTLPLLQRALQHQVAFVPGHAFYADAPDSATMRLNFSHATPARIEEGIRRLAAVVRSPV